MLLRNPKRASCFLFQGTDRQAVQTGLYQHFTGTKKHGRHIFG